MDDSISCRSHPEGRRLPALERNILKYRALEMAIVLFHVEDLKTFVLDSIQATDGLANRLNGRSPRIPNNAKKKYELAWQILVEDRILSKDESAEIQRLIDYRNEIAHRIHDLTCDLSRYPGLRDHAGESRYDYTAIEKLKRFREKIERGLRSRYVMMLSYRSLLFEDAERTYQEELHRLDKKIRRQLAARKEKNNRLNAELETDRTLEIAKLEPYHPLNINANGTLTARGVDVCYHLFDNSFSALAVAHLMGISYKASTSRRKAWEAARGG
jgi:hypothetical protein